MRTNKHRLKRSDRSTLKPGVISIVRAIAFVFALSAVLMLISCGNDNGEGKEKLNVVTTIGMIADVTENIGGEYTKVTGLMGPGVDPHLYKASEGDVSRLSKADLILFNGLHLEAKMGEVLERLDGRITTVAVAEVIEESKLITVESYGGSHDPHVWFDVSLWMEVAGAIRDALIEADPDHNEAYTEAHAEYAKKLEELNDFVNERVSELDPEQRILVTAHDAFSYFGKAYGFEVRGLQGISTVSEAGTADVRELADYIAENEIAAIFVESSVPRKNVEALQAAVKSRGFDVEIGGELFSDAMGDEGTAEGTYIGMVRHNVNTIVDSLKGN